MRARGLRCAGARRARAAAAARSVGEAALAPVGAPAWARAHPARAAPLRPRARRGGERAHGAVRRRGRGRGRGRGSVSAPTKESSATVAVSAAHPPMADQLERVHMSDMPLVHGRFSPLIRQYARACAPPKNMRSSTGPVCAPCWVRFRVRVRVLVRVRVTVKVSCLAWVHGSWCTSPTAASASRRASIASTSRSDVRILASMAHRMSYVAWFGFGFGFRFWFGSRRWPVACDKQSRGSRRGRRAAW